MRRIFWLGACVFCLLGLFVAPVLAAEIDGMEMQQRLQEELEKLDTASIDRAAAEWTQDASFSQMLRDILAGEFDFSLEGIKERLTEAAFGEFRIQGRLLAQLLLVVLLSAMLKQLSDSFQGKAAGEMGFAICYMVLMVVLLSAFYALAQSVVERMQGICSVFQAMLPLFLLLSVSGGNPVQSAWMGSTIIGGSAALAAAMQHILLPAILLAISLEFADHISTRPILGKFAQLLRQCIGWGMKGAAMGFMLLLSIRKIGGGALQGLAAKTAKIAVGAVPIVGEVMGGAVEMTAAVAGTLRNGTLAAAAIFLLLLCIPIVVKLVVIWLVFKLTAAAAEFICEQRLVECIAAAGEYTALLLGVIFLGEGMFLFSALLLLGGL